VPLVNEMLAERKSTGVSRCLHQITKKAVACSSRRSCSTRAELPVEIGLHPPVSASFGAFIGTPGSGAFRIGFLANNKRAGPLLQRSVINRRRGP